MPLAEPKLRDNDATTSTTHPEDHLKPEPQQLKMADKGSNGRPSGDRDFASIAQNYFSPYQVQHIKTYRTQYAAMGGSIVSTIIAYPLESIKTRLQGDSPNFRQCINHMYYKEGMYSFWRGVWAPVASITLVRTFGFSVYQRSKYGASRFIAEHTDHEEPLVAVNRPGSMPDWATAACFGFAGAMSGAFSTLVSCPFELNKNAMVLAHQINSNNKTGKPDNHPIRSSYVGKNTVRTMSQIVKNCGFSGLYCGFNLQMTREVLGTATYFMSYESIKQTIVAYRGSNSPTSPLAVAAAGGCCGMFSLTITYPIDIAKTAYQKRRLELGRPKGLRAPPVKYFSTASYQGLGVAAARSCVTNAILFSIFERAKKYINELEKEGR